MWFKSIVFAAIIALALTGIPVFAQVQSVEDVETPEPQYQDHGGVTPWFWIGIQTVFGAGYNIETTAGGFRNYGGDNHTYASFNLAFVDSHYMTPKFYEVPKELDPDAWTGHFVLKNFTARLNSWTGDTEIENNAPAWLAEITGKGARIGFFTQAGQLIGGLQDDNRKMKDNKPITSIYGGNKVLNLGTGQLGRLFYERTGDSKTVTKYSTNNAVDNGGGLMYVGYEKLDLFNVFLTMLSEGNVNSAIGENSEGKETNKGFAGVIDFGVTPFGVFADEGTPLTLDISGNFIAGFNFVAPSANANQNVGFGLKTEGGLWLLDNMVISPIVAFDGKLDTETEFFWKVGGGVSFRFSGMRWMHDEWGDLFNNGYNVTSRSFPGNENFASHRYENNKILKYAYAQVYAAYSEDSDFNLLFRVEEPDGEAGFHNKLGALFETRLYNLTEENNAMSWEMQGRVSWDVNIGQHIVTPYLRGYLNQQQVVKLRIGAYANFIPFTGFEIAYTSANLNFDADTTAKPMSHYKGIGDAGRIEFLVILKSDDIRPTVPKRMSDWNYPTVIQEF
jgi:hypothetical protein